MFGLTRPDTAGPLGTGDAPRDFAASARSPSEAKKGRERLSDSPLEAGGGFCLYDCSVEHERLMAELLGAAQKLGLRVRVEPFLTVGDSAGGICKVLGKTVVLIDASSPILDRTAALARILATVDHESVYLAPEAREYIYAQMRPRSP